MEESARRYARNILLLHMVLLAVVVLLVYFAGHEVYTSTRQQVLDQTAKRQALLANQTARGIESFYNGVLSDLDLLQRSENDEGPGPATPPTTRPMQMGRGRAFIFGRPLWRQLESRASHLFVFDKTNQTAIPIGQRKDVLPLGEIVDRTNPWLSKVTTKSVSTFQIFGDQGVNLVCIPADPQNNRVLAAVVPVAQVEELFFNKINSDPKMGATLIDDTNRAMAASNRQLIGVNLTHVNDTAMRDRVTGEMAKGRPFELQVEQSLHIGNIQFQPAVVAFEPVKLPGKQWWIYIALPISEIDGVLDDVFHRVQIWAWFLIISVTAILVSTSVQMIRGRVRVERIRHEMLTKELEQARQIQLAWLPPAQVPESRVQIAAINEPANHISGDFYNWFDLPDGRTVVVIGDVTGHGMSAAFLMATTQLLVRTIMLRVGDPGRCMEEVNRQLCVQVFNGQFVTMLICAIDADEQTLDIAVSGHPAPLILDSTGAAALPITPQMVLGVESDSDYPTERYPFLPGTQLVMYTDGVPDALAPDGTRLRTEGFVRTLNSTAASVDELLQSIVEGLARFRGSKELCDDLTLVAMQLNPATADRSDLVSI